jgi:hypothetical protein
MPLHDGRREQVGQCPPVEAHIGREQKTAEVKRLLSVKAYSRCPSLSQRSALGSDGMEGRTASRFATSQPSAER